MFKLVLAIFIAALASSQETILSPSEIDFYVKVNLQKSYVRLDQLKKQEEEFDQEIASLLTAINNSYGTYMLDGAGSGLNELDIVKEIAEGELCVNHLGDVELNEQQKNLMILIGKKSARERLLKEIIAQEQDIQERSEVIRYTLLS